MPNLNPLFENGTISIFTTEPTLDGTEFVETETEVYTDIPCQICCGDGSRDIQSCGPTRINKKDLTVKIRPTYTITIDKDRSSMIAELSDCLGDLGRFRIEDVGCVDMPSGGLYAYELRLTLIDG